MSQRCSVLPLEPSAGARAPREGPHQQEQGRKPSAVFMEQGTTGEGVSQLPSSEELLCALE